MPTCSNEIRDKTRNKKGIWAEKIAAQFLCSRGYTLRGTQVRTRFGEIDIVAQKEEIIVFVEVKMRTHNREAQAEMAIDTRKQQRLHRAIQSYIARYHLDGCIMRFDVIAIFQKTPTTFGIRHYSHVPFLFAI